MKWLSKSGKDDDLLIASHFFFSFSFFETIEKKIISMPTNKTSRFTGTWIGGLGGSSSLHLVETKQPKLGKHPLHDWLSLHQALLCSNERFGINPFLKGFIPSPYLVKFPHHVITVSFFSCFFACIVPCKPSVFQDASPSHLMRFLFSHLVFLKVRSFLSF